MPFDNLSGNHYLPEEMKKVRELLNEALGILQSRFGNLSAKERQKFSTIGEYNKLIVNKVKEYHENEPDLSCDEINWEEFAADYNDRLFLSAIIGTMQRGIQGMTNTRMLHDADNYKAALRDYEYTQYKNNGNDARFEVKQRELKKFFNKSKSSKDLPKDDSDILNEDTGED